MKKFFMFIALIMGFMFATNAQTIVTDTVFYTEGVVLMANDTTDEGEYYVTTFYEAADSSDCLTDSVFIEFNVSGLDTTASDIILLYVDDDIFSTVLDSIGDTLVMTPLFTEGYNHFYLGDSIYSIGLMLISDLSDTHMVTLTDIIITRVYEDTVYVSTPDINPVHYNVYPNPVHNMIHIEGAFKTISIYDIKGRLMGVYNTHDINLGYLRTGTYFLRIDNKTIKIQKI